MAALPSFVARSLARIAAGGAVAAATIVVAAMVVERTKLGADLDASRARLRAEVEGQFATLTVRLDTAARAVTLTGDELLRAGQGEVAATRRLFDQADAAARAASVAVTIYGANNDPLAWTGRSENVPVERRTGPASLFLAQSAQGLEVVRVQPVLDPDDTARHIGAIVAETPISRPGTPDLGGGARFRFDTSVVPVALRLPFEGAAETRPDAFVVRSPAGDPLVDVLVSDADLMAARQQIRDRLLGAEFALGGLLLLLMTGVMLDWRRAVRTVRAAVWLSVLTALFIIGARALFWVAARKAGLAEPSLMASTPWTTLGTALLASPLDFLLHGLTAAGLVSITVSGFVRWRESGRPGVGVVVVDRPKAGGLFLLTQVCAGVAVTALVVWYEHVLRTHVSQTPVDILRFAIDRWDPIRLAIIVGLVAWNAAIAGFAILLLRAAVTPWVFATHQWSWRWRGVAAWLLPAVVMFWPAVIGDLAPAWPSLVVLVFLAASAWLAHRYAARLRHSSQATRLLMSFLAIALPSVAFYPSLLDAASRARRQLIEGRYAVEVLHQRQDVHLKLERALAEIDRVSGLEDMVRASEPPPTGAPPIGAAFLAWSQTSLATERLTSSVELHNAAGVMVSRFAMNLPDFTQPQPWTEQTCDWEILEEVSPLFSEERRLLHAGRALCGSNGRRFGSIVVHSMLDYGNLSFVSAQDPYVALIRSGQPMPEPRPRADVEFYVYGWSRRVLFSSVDDPPPLGETPFRQAFTSRTPFWTTVTRGPRQLDTYVMSDRGAIYVLGVGRQDAVGHIVTLAELLALVFVVFTVAVLGGMVFNLLAGRPPASGRALLDEVRASFYRKLFLAFVASAIIPVLALALVSRAYMAGVILADIESEATRLATTASRVFQDLRAFVGQQAVDDDIIVWLSRVVAQDVNIFSGTELLASSERNLFASGLLPTRTPGEVFRAIALDGRPSFVGRESAGGLEYLTAATPVQIEGRGAVLTIPLASRQQETDAQIDELDRRVLLAAVLFIMLGAGIGYYMAERIADPVNRLMRATRRIARGDLDARVLATSADELRRLVDAFNQMADDLQRQRRELERTNRLAAWADMARQVAHDIKNPLTPIQLNAEHVRRVHVDQGKPLGNVIDECVTNILGQVRLLRQIAAEFSSFAAVPEPRPAATNLHELVEEVVQPYRSGLEGRVAIDTHVPAHLPPLLIDRVLIGRALTNIIENALHAMPGGGTLTITAALAPDRRAQLRVTDTGVGMDAEALAKIFEPYFSTKAIGTGLGLTIAKRNVEASGGSVSVTSDLGRGTSVTMTLPLVDRPSS